MEGRLAAARGKGLDKREWQRYYNQHQQTYKRNKLKAVELAVAHPGSFRSLVCISEKLTRVFRGKVISKLAGGWWPVCSSSGYKNRE